MDGRGKTSAERPAPNLVRFPPWGPGLGCTPSFTAYDDRWQEIRRFQTSPPPVSIVIRFRRSPAWRPGSTQQWVGRGLVDVMSRIHGAQRPSHSAGGDQGGLHSRIWGTIANVPPRQCGDVRPFPVPRSPQRLPLPVDGRGSAACGLHKSRCRPILREIYILQFTHRR